MKQMTKDDREDIRGLYKRAKNKKTQLNILRDMFPDYTKQQIIEAAEADPFRNSDAAWRKFEMGASTTTFDTQTKLAAVRSVLLDGESRREVGERYGVSGQTISNWIKWAKKTQTEFMEYADTVEKELSSKNNEDIEADTDVIIDTKNVEEATSESEDDMLDNLENSMFRFGEAWGKFERLGILTHRERVMLKSIGEKVNSFAAGVRWERNRHS